MLRFLFAFCFLAGLTNGLQPTLHYVYRYFGSVSAGIPELSTQMTGWAMVSDVHIYADRYDGVITIQLENFKAKGFNDKLGCDGKFNIPFDQFEKIPQDIHSIVESPYRVNLLDNGEYAIEVEENTPNWLIDMRKSIVSIVRNVALKGNFLGDDSEQFNLWELDSLHDEQEETILGKCKSDYISNVIPKSMTGSFFENIKKHLKNDVQTESQEKLAYTSKTSRKTTSKTSRKGSTKTHAKTAGRYSKSNVPELEDYLWHVVRSIDFDDCDEMVATQKTPLGFETDVNKQQHEWSRSRSSVTDYIFRGLPGNMRMESANVIGTTSMAPTGLVGNVVQSFTNQTLELINVDIIKNVPQLSGTTKKTNKFSFELWKPKSHPSSESEDPNSFNAFRTDFGWMESIGIDPLTPKELDYFKNDIKEKIKKASLGLSDFDQEIKTNYASELLSHVQTATLSMKAMNTKESILEIFNHFFENDVHQNDIVAKKLIVDSAVASGTYPAIEAVFDYIEKDKIPQIQVMSIFMTLLSTMQTPGNLYRILGYVLSLDLKQKPFLTSTVLINYSEMLHKMCIRKEAPITFYLGVNRYQGCNEDQIINKYISHLKSIIYEDTSAWEKDVAIRALGGLGTKKSLEILKPVVTGELTCNKQTRALAFYALQSWNLHDTDDIRLEIVKLMVNATTNIGEAVEVREAALSALLSWKPKSSFFYHLARLTWKEPNHQMATFITSVIQSVADAKHPYFKTQNQAAYHALKLAKPVAPSSKYSIMQSMSTHLANIEASKFSRFVEHKSGENFELKELFIYMMSDYGGFQMNTLKYSMFTEGIQVFLNNLKTQQEVEKTETIEMQVAADFVRQIQDTIKAKIVSTSAKEPRLDISYRIFDHMEVLLPFNQETVKTLPLADLTNIAAFLLQLSVGYDLVLAKYFKPIDLNSFFPSELGLPLFISSTTEILYSECSFSKLNLGSKTPSPEALEKMTFNSEVLSRLNTVSSAGIGILYPWTAETGHSGVLSQREVTLPLLITLKSDKPEASEVKSTFDIELKSLYKKKFSIAKATNIPFTMKMPLIPSRGDALDFKMVHSSAPAGKVIPFNKAFTGIDAQLNWHSDISLGEIGLAALMNNNLDYKSIMGHPYFLYMFTSPTLKYWNVDIIVDPSTSSTDSIKFQFAKGADEEAQTSDQWTQKTGQTQDSVDWGQSAGDLEQENDFGQESISVEDLSDSFNEVEDFGEGVPQKAVKYIQYDETFAQKFRKIKKQIDVGDGHTKTCGMKISFAGPSEIRTYEAIVGMTKQMSRDTKVYQTNVAFFRSPIPEVDEESAEMCLNVQSKKPFLSQLSDPRSVFSRDLKKQMRADLLLGCTGQPISTVKFVATVSDEWKQKLKNEVEGYCSYDNHDSVYSYRHSLTYSDVNLSVIYKQVPELERFPLTSKLFDYAGQALSAILPINFCKGDDHHFKANAHRCPKSGRWDVDIESDEIPFKLESLGNDESLNKIMGVFSYSFDSPMQSKTTYDMESNMCDIGLNNVRTFDGLVYEYPSTQCWTVASKLCTKESGKILLVRSSSTESIIPEAKYIDPLLGLVAEFARNELIVNGEKIEPYGSEGEIIHRSEDGKTVKVFKEGNNFMIFYSPQFYIVFKDTIKVKAQSSSSGLLCGLCGNYDGEPTNDFIGPKRCYYDDASLFASSWTTKSDTCNVYDLIRKRQEAEKYQETCTTVESIPAQCY